MIVYNVVCPVCGQHTFKASHISELCPVCYWWNDPVQNDEPDFEGGENDLSLNQYRKQWQEKQAAESAKLQRNDN